MSAFATIRTLATTAVGFTVAGAGLLPSTLALPTGTQSTDIATAPTLPQGVSFEEGLTLAQQERIAEIVQSASTLLSATATRGGGSCAAKTACYASTCWIPFVGLACLSCDNVQCRREAEPEPLAAAQLSVRRADNTCLGRKAFCYQVHCPLLPAGITIQPSEACKACDAIQCNMATVRESEVQPSTQLPAGMQFQEGLTASQQDRIVEIVQSAPTMLFAAATRSGGSCAAKTACYASTCWIPFVGLACLACDNVQC